MDVFFGYPFFSTSDECSNKMNGRVEIYFKKKIKVTMEHQSYSFLSYCHFYKSGVHEVP